MLLLFYCEEIGALISCSICQRLEEIFSSCSTGGGPLTGIPSYSKLFRSECRSSTVRGPCVKAVQACIQELTAVPEELLVSSF